MSPLSSRWRHVPPELLCHTACLRNFTVDAEFTLKVQHPFGNKNRAGSSHHHALHCVLVSSSLALCPSSPSVRSTHAALARFFLFYPLRCSLYVPFTAHISLSLSLYLPLSPSLSPPHRARPGGFCCHGRSPLGGGRRSQKHRG